MNPDNNAIITEDGQRLTIEDGLINGTDDPKPGLAHQTGNVLDETNRADNEGGACPVAAHKNSDTTGAQQAISENANK